MEHIIDASHKKLGRLASEVAIILQGKKSPDYDQRLAGRDSVRIKNIDKMAVGRGKMKQKIYYRHTTQIGHLKKQTLSMLWQKKGPAEVLKLAVLRMLPKNKLRNQRMKRLNVEN